MLHADIGVSFRSVKCQNNWREEKREGGGDGRGGGGGGGRGREGVREGVKKRLQIEALTAGKMGSRECHLL